MRGRPRTRYLNSGLAAMAAVAIGLGTASLGPPGQAPVAPRLGTVARGVVQTVVSATGNVQDPGNLALNFKSGGVLTEVDIAPGAHVTAGEVLARIDPADAKGSLTTAQANLASAQAKLAQLEQGLTPQEAAQNQVAAAQAAAAVNSARVALADTQRLVSVNAAGYQAAVDGASSQLARDQGQLASDQRQTSADQAQLARDQSAGDQTAVAADQQKVGADQQKVASDSAATGKDADAIAAAGSNQTQGQLKDQQSLHSAQNSLTNAEMARQSTLAGNAVKAQPPKPGDLAAAQAAVASAQVAQDTAQRAYDATTLTAPVDATVATVGAKVGESVSGGGGASSGSSSAASGGSSSSSAGGGGGGTAASSSSGTASTSTTGFITLTDLAGLQVKAGFSETDAARIAPGQPATITLDAVPGQQFAAHVVTLDEAATVVSNVVTYNATFQFDNDTPGVKPGMTANVTVITDHRDDVLHVPGSAVQTRGGSTSVLVVKSGKQTSVPVVVGLRGDDATEVVSGLAAGDSIVVSSGTRFTATGATGATPAGATGAGGGAGRGLGGGGLGGGGLGGGGRG